MDLNRTPENAPTIELGGINYTVAINPRVLSFRLSRAGVDAVSAFRELHSGATVRTLAFVVQMFRCVIEDQFHGTDDDLADLLLRENKVVEAGQVLKAAFEQLKAQEAARPSVPLQPNSTSRVN